MTLKQALEILAREQHNGHTRWDGTCPPGNPAWRTEFECIAIAEAYERMRDPDPCAALRARLESAQAESADLQRLSEARFQRNNALECLNKEQEADLASLRTRLENTASALREARGYVALQAIRCGPNVGSATIDLLHRIDAALAEAGES